MKSKMSNLVLRICILTLFVEVLAVQGQCMPTNWNYAWFKVGKTWFTKIDVARPWLEQIKECKKIEAKSVIGTIRTKDESTMVHSKFPELLLLGAFEIKATGQWFWWNGVGGSPEQIKNFYWASGEPSNDRGIEGCLMTGYSGGGWNDVSCLAKWKALCEIRC